MPVYMDVESFRSTFLPKLPSSSPSAWPPDVVMGPSESGALQFFQTQTLALLCPIFPSELWERTLLAVAHSVPAILYLVLATGLYHQSLNSLGLNAWRQPDCITSHESAALRHYTAAVRLVRESASTTDPPIPIIKLACVMFTVLEFLRGNRATTVSHLLNGMKLLEARHGSRQLDPLESEVESALSRLSLMQSLYGRPRSELFPTLQTVPIAEANMIYTASFSDIHEARSAMVHLSSRVFLLVRRVEKIQASPQTADILTEQKDLSLQLLQWSDRIEELGGMVTDVVDCNAVGLLRVYHTIAFVFLKTATTQYQTSFDLYTPLFRSVIESLEVIIDGLLSQSGGPALFSLDLAIIPCLFYTAIKCRLPELRRKAVSLLERVPRREGLWDAKEAALVAERVIEFEERFVCDDELRGSFSIPEESRIHDVDIREAAGVNEKAELCIVLRWRPYATCISLEESYVRIGLP